MYVPSTMVPPVNAGSAAALAVLFTTGGSGRALHTPPPAPPAPVAEVDPVAPPEPVDDVAPPPAPVVELELPVVSFELHAAMPRKHTNTAPSPLRCMSLLWRAARWI